MSAAGVVRAVRASPLMTHSRFGPVGRPFLGLGARHGRGSTPLGAHARVASLTRSLVKRPKL